MNSQLSKKQFPCSPGKMYCNTLNLFFICKIILPFRFVAFLNVVVLGEVTIKITLLLNGSAVFCRKFESDMFHLLTKNNTLFLYFLLY